MLKMDNVIVKMPYGSSLYGTRTPTSDKDFKGVYIPSKKDLYFQTVKNSLRYNTKKNQTVKNTKADVDIEFFSLLFFLKMAKEGNIIAMDMLHCPPDFLLQTSDIWEKIVSERSRFYTKNIATFVDYARGQAAKYGIKGSRLYDAKQIIKYFEQFADQPAIKVKDVFDGIPKGINIKIYPAEGRNRFRTVEVCNRKIQETIRVKYALEMVKKFYDTYGQRSKDAEENKNIDWRAVSHAIRAGYQLKQLYLERTITFPLKERDYLRQVKKGEIPYKEVAPILDELVDEVVSLADKTDLPKECDGTYWDEFINEIYDDFIKRSFDSKLEVLDGTEPEESVIDSIEVKEETGYKKIISRILSIF